MSQFVAVFLMPYNEGIADNGWRYVYVADYGLLLCRITLSLFRDNYLTVRIETAMKYSVCYGLALY